MDTISIGKIVEIVLDDEKFCYKKIISECLFIKTDINSINLDTDLLCSSYNSTLDRFKNLDLIL